MFPNACKVDKIYILRYTDAAVEYGKICADQQRKGAPIGTMDMLIAGHAKAEHVILITNNIRKFERVEGLRLENWAEA